MDSAFSSVKNHVQTLQSKIVSLEENVRGMLQETRTTNSAVTALEETLARTSTQLEEKIDQLESFSRRDDNLKFVNIPQAADEGYDTCAMKVVDILRGTVPNKQWYRDDIVRAHRLRNNNNYRNNGSIKSQPMIAKCTRWSDKMDILTKQRKGGGGTEKER